MHLNLTESCAEAGIYATSEAERAKDGFQRISCTQTGDQ